MPCPFVPISARMDLNPSGVNHCIRASKRFKSIHTVLDSIESTYSQQKKYIHYKAILRDNMLITTAFHLS